MNAPALITPGDLALEATVSRPRSKSSRSSRKAAQTSSPERSIFIESRSFSEQWSAAPATSAAARALLAAVD